jgi:predicted nucleic acid-binding protein
LPHVVVDANVLVSFFVERNEEQRLAGKALLLSAQDGEITVVVPHSVLLEIAYVLGSFYKIHPSRIHDAIRATIAYPGVITTYDCPWSRVLELWPDPIRSINDACLVALAVANNYDSIATFDERLITQMRAFGVRSHF